MKLETYIYIIVYHICFKFHSRHIASGFVRWYYVGIAKRFRWLKNRFVHTSLISSSRFLDRKYVRWWTSNQLLSVVTPRVCYIFIRLPCNNLPLYTTTPVSQDETTLENADHFTWIHYHIQIFSRQRTARMGPGNHSRSCIWYVRKNRTL